MIESMAGRTKEVKKIRIALLGLGTVGSGVWEILKSNNKEVLNNSGYDIEIAKILVRDADRKRGVKVPKQLITTNFNDIIEDDSIKIIVEVMGGINPTKEYILKSIRRGKHIVTANKMLLAIHGEEIFKLAKEEGVKVFYEASVAGGIPIINSISESLTANKIDDLYGIINGTTNYILTKMQSDNMSFEDALKEAQEKGYVEEDMTSDIDAYDAQYKLSILANLAFGTKVDLHNIYREGISEVTMEDMINARELGYCIKLLAIAKTEDDELELRVHPTMIPLTHPLANVSSCFNSIFIKGNVVGDLMFYGAGAGGLATGSAIVSDIIAIIKNINNESKYSFEADKKILKIKNIDDIETVIYTKLNINNDSKIISKVLEILELNNVTLKSFNTNNINKEIELSLMTSKSREKNIKTAIENLKKNNIINKVSSFIRVEDFSKI